MIGVAGGGRPLMVIEAVLAGGCRRGRAGGHRFGFGPRYWLQLWLVRCGSWRFG